MKKKPTKKNASATPRIENIKGMYPAIPKSYLLNQDQVDAVEKNIGTIDGMKRLLNKNNPYYWYIVILKVSWAQMDYRWTGRNEYIEDDNDFRKSICHRAIHLLRLPKKFTNEKKEVIAFLLKINAEHPRWIEDIIDYCQSIEKKEDHENTVEYCYLMVYNVLSRWNIKYPYPEKVIDFCEVLFKRMSSTEESSEKEYKAILNILSVSPRCIHQIYIKKLFSNCIESVAWDDFPATVDALKLAISSYKGKEEDLLLISEKTAKFENLSQPILQTYSLLETLLRSRLYWPKSELLKKMDVFEQRFSSLKVDKTIDELQKSVIEIRKLTEIYYYRYGNVSRARKDVYHYLGDEEEEISESGKVIHIHSRFMGLPFSLHDEEEVSVSDLDSMIENHAEQWNTIIPQNLRAVHEGIKKAWLRKLKKQWKRAPHEQQIRILQVINVISGRFFPGLAIYSTYADYLRWCTLFGFTEDKDFMKKYVKATLKSGREGERISMFKAMKDRYYWRETSTWLRLKLLQHLSSSLSAIEKNVLLELIEKSGNKDPAWDKNQNELLQNYLHAEEDGVLTEKVKGILRELRKIN